MRRWVLALVCAAFCACAAPAGCGVPKPPPLVPPGEQSCDVGCARVVELHCGTSAELCHRLCDGVARHNPAYPTCLARGATCAAENACGGEESDGDATNGPGEGRSGP